MFIDFQATGESPGSTITFDHLKSHGAQEVVTEPKKLAPAQHHRQLEGRSGRPADAIVDAVMLEQVRHTLAQTLDDYYLRLHAGPIGTWLEPLMAITVRPHLHARDALH